MADTEDTETLAGIVFGYFWGDAWWTDRFHAAERSESMEAADAILTSSWLAARDERIRADEREKLAAVEGQNIIREAKK